MAQLETAVITRTDYGFEMTDNTGENIGNFSDWNQVAEMFRQQHFSEEYIAKRKFDLDHLAKTEIDETNE